MRIRRVAVVLWGAFVVNLGVFAIRLFLNHTTGSAAILAEAFHAFTDSLSSLIALLALWFAKRPPDQRHPRGHHRFEHRAIIVIGGLILVAAIEVIRTTAAKLSRAYAPTFSLEALGVLLATMACAAAVTFVERRVGKREGSALLLADARHTASDLLASGAVLVGYGATAIGIAALDLAAGVLIGATIGWTGIELILRYLRPCSDPDHNEGQRRS